MNDALLNPLPIQIGGLPTIWRAITFSQPTNSNIDFSHKYLHRDTRMVATQYVDTLWLS